MSDDSRSFFYYPHGPLAFAKLDDEENQVESDDSEDEESLFERMSPPDEDGVLFKPASIIEPAEELSENFKKIDIENKDIFTLVKSNNFYAVKDILEGNPRLANQINRFGFTPLMCAANRNYCAIAEYLIEKGARLDAEKEGWTALMLAAAEGNTLVVAFLVEKHADVLLANNDRKATALIVAVSNGHGDVVKILANANASKEHIMHQDKKGRTAIVHALKRNRVDIALYLLGIISPLPIVEGSFSEIRQIEHDEADQKISMEMVASQNEVNTQLALIPPANFEEPALSHSKQLLSAYLGGMSLVLGATIRETTNFSPPIKPFYTNEEWRQRIKDENLKALFKRVKVKG